MNRHSIRIAGLLMTVAALALAGAAAAQDQPPVAVNQQDERINLNRDLDPAADTFKILRSGDKRELNRYITKVYQLQNANPFEIFPYIDSIVGLEKGTVRTARNVGPDGEMRMWMQVNVPEFLIPSLDAAIAAYDVPNFISAPGFVAFSYRTQHRSAAEIVDFISISSGTGEGKIRADPITNTIYFEESPSDFRRVFSTIQFVDVPVPQVDMEIMMIELTEIDQTSLGLYWDAWKTMLGGGLTGEFETTRTNPDVGSTVEDTFSRISGTLSIGATALARFLNYLVDEGAAEIIVQTNLNAANGETAVMNSSTGLPEFTYVGPEGDSELVETITEAEGIRIEIRPVVATQSTRLDVSIHMRSPVGVDRLDNFIFSTQDYSTNLTVSDGELYKIGGLNRGTGATENRGIPGLRSIPGLKYLFNNEVKVVRKSQVFLFILPRWSAPQLTDLQARDFHGIVEPFTVAGLLKANPNLKMSGEDADMLQRFYDNRN